MMRSIHRNALALMVVASVTSCGGRESASPSPGSAQPAHTPRPVTADDLHIETARPAFDTPLRAGQQSNISVTVNCSLVTADEGSLDVNIQESRAGAAPVFTRTLPVKRGGTRITLNADFTVPDVPTLQVSARLTPKGSGKPAVDTGTYKISKP